MSFIDELLSDVTIPKMVKIRQKFDTPVEIKDIEAKVHAEFIKDDIRGKIKPNMSIAIGLGSRGIAQIDRIAKAVVAEVKLLGAKPYVVPAMGSHGGATAEGQKHMLEHLGMSEEVLGCEIRSSMETVKVGQLPNGLEVLMDKNAMEADGIICVNRIKAHNGFTAPIESGIIKMLSIGFAKQKGADSCHTQGFGEMGHNIVEMAKIKVANTPFLFGIGTIENAYDQVVDIAAIPSDKLIERETELLAKSKGYFPKIMFNDVDICVVDLIGKIYSGGGMDCHVTGRASTPFIQPIASIRPDRIVVLDLHEKSAGNASGMGFADFSTQRLLDKVIFSETYPNVLTSRLSRDGYVPVIFPNDKQAIQAAVKTCVISKSDRSARMIRIANSLHIDEFYISENMLNDAKANSNIEILSEPRSLNFDEEDNLTDIGLHG